MPSPPPSPAHPLVIEPASQLQRREPHRMEVLAWPTGVLGVRPHPSSSASTRSEYEPRRADRLNHVVHQEPLVLPELEELCARWIKHQLSDAFSSWLPPVLQLLDKVAVLHRLVVPLFPPPAAPSPLPPPTGSRTVYAKRNCTATVSRVSPPPRTGCTKRGAAAATLPATCGSGSSKTPGRVSG